MKNQIYPNIGRIIATSILAVALSMPAVFSQEVTSKEISPEEATEIVNEGHVQFSLLIYTANDSGAIARNPIHMEIYFDSCTFENAVKDWIEKDYLPDGFYRVIRLNNKFVKSGYRDITIKNGRLQ